MTQTPTPYEAAIIRRFGYIPSWKTLAAIENEHARRHWGTLNFGNHGTEDRRRGWVSCLPQDRPFTVSEAGQAWAIPDNSARSRLITMFTAGMVRRASDERNAPYEVCS